MNDQYNLCSDIMRESYERMRASQKRNQVNDIFEERDVFCLCIIFHDDDYGWLSNVGSIVVYIICTVQLYTLPHTPTLPW